jgi:hypothetical protein
MARRQQCSAAACSAIQVAYCIWVLSLEVDGIGMDAGLMTFKLLVPCLTPQFPREPQRWGKLGPCSHRRSRGGNYVE